MHWAVISVSQQSSSRVEDDSNVLPVTINVIWQLLDENTNCRGIQPRRSICRRWGCQQTASEAPEAVASRYNTVLLDQRLLIRSIER